MLGPALGIQQSVSAGWRLTASLSPPGKPKQDVFPLSSAPTGLFCSNFLSKPLAHSLMVEPRLLCCTWPSRKWRKKKPPTTLHKGQPGLSSAGQCGVFILVLVQHLLLGQEATVTSRQAGMIEAKQELQGGLIPVRRPRQHHLIPQHGDSSRKSALQCHNHFSSMAVKQKHSGPKHI